MKTRIAAAVSALVLGLAPVSSAMAFGPGAPFQPSHPRDVGTTGSIGGWAPLGAHDGPLFDRCDNPAAEGNARQQNRPVKQYGQVSGGPRC
ncbi:hypothetical protein [Methylobacterium sp. WSM2598]|uniref:hypothetical protein n=1 Tax=Methylobacterium sp. WSM2598 TaxID=398261 RepID=UPI00035E3D9C|nr:hypothetical protein [Methylobacterium sp. WSM2598]